jgi:hypothetical protein
MKLGVEMVINLLQSAFVIGSTLLLPGLLAEAALLVVD